MRKICVIHDSKTEGYLDPMFVRATGEAIRIFKDEVNRVASNGQLSPLAAHPEDFTLFEIGSWDEQTGTLMVYPAKKSLGLGLDFKDSEPSGSIRAV